MGPAADYEHTPARLLMALQPPFGNPLAWPQAGKSVLASRESLADALSTL